jgi:kumamolisin
MMAPGSHIHIFASAQNDDEGELALFTAVADDNRSKVVNYSWGSCEKYVGESHRADMDSVFARLVAQGINVLVASGDYGTDGCGDGGTEADWPALHPHLVAVGGTSVYMNADGTKNERGWSGSGGGVSSYYKLPSWQSDFKSPFVRRSYPDISFNADPTTGEGIWVRSGLNAQPAWQQIGGTSMAAPQWVGFLGMINETRQNNGKKPLGFINPILYGASSESKKELFNDILTGKNGLYTANEGWDAVTGWGSMNGAAMYEYLVSH